MKNFQVKDKDTGKKYWISRAMAVCGIVVVEDEKEGEYYVLANKRGQGAPNYKGCWNLICGYLDWDETLVDAVTREVLEETKVAIPKHLWKQVAIADDPNKDELQNVTVRFKAYITKDEYDEYRLLGENAMGVDGGEENEVECVKLIKLDTETVNSLEWAFNHKSLVENEIAFANLLKPYKK